ncbi:hypothetical protein AVEN_182666-1 [Araneus ventricosus]|uniref:PiggyBac transposable element-derived protein domain-containing protein n=1 Tax=Araneus ventricosus TaxID=182803 RepID=A0A4Y2T2K2_ARAVE|nr:hypothetical protein AVEN_182666-1 [Araneus ventricosus]
MPSKFLTAQEALDFLWTLDDSDLDDIDNELVILPPDIDALSDTEDIDDSSTWKMEETMCDDQGITNVHYITYYNKYKNRLTCLIIMPKLILHQFKEKMVLVFIY